MLSTPYVVKKAMCLILLMSTATCQLPTHVERAHVLEAHLHIRETVVPPASNMQLMEYSEELENLAAYWASHCRFEHPDTNSYPHYNGLGQNIALISGFTPSLIEGVCGWRGGSQHYTYSNNTCDGEFGAYTQVRGHCLVIS
ncbi:unnamed protein product [Hydatigera taeniaeformis]|uniref:SCP domain-containing protein n=1 Tax=Hydatigena taeniaeformis TaxID=6205 RepID=A0A0R3WU35_HYDTA|nr:unnamed protein product [Hydatigera taeniaeformis]